MIQPNSVLNEVISTATDLSVVCEIYSSDAEPTEAGFDPATAIKRYANVNGITFRGLQYTRLVKKYGSVTRSVTPEINTASVDFSNLSREIAEFEFNEGFEGLIIVFRLISRSLSLELEDSFVLCIRRCEKPKSGNRETLSVSAKQILGSVDVEIPRRKFSPEDTEGRPFTDNLFEGFLYIPQYGVTTYSVRKKFLGITIGKKRKTLQWSSFSDIDADTSVSESFGRVQVGGIHLAYADIGSRIQITTAFCEGEIDSYLQIRFDDPRFSVFSNYIAYKYGELGGIGLQIADHVGWIGNAIYSRTAYIRAELAGSNVDDVEPAPTAIAVLLAKKLRVPNESGVWTNAKVWSDNPASVVQFALSSNDYYKFGDNWIDYESFTESFKFNDEFIFDSANSDLLFVTDSDSFQNITNIDTAKYLLPTSSVTTNYFKYLNKDISAAEAFGLKSRSIPVNTSSSIDPGDIDPDDPPNGGGGTDVTRNLLFFLRRRYTCNVVASDTQNLIDFLYQTVFPSSRLFLTQSQTGKFKLHNKKAVDFALGTVQFTQGTNSIAVDDCSKWVNNLSQLLLIDPNTDKSEIKKITDANYSSAQNSISISASSNITVSGFSGCDGNSTAATASFVIADVGTSNFFSIDGIQIDFTPAVSDTTSTIAGFIYATVNAHPTLSRRFAATWVVGSSTVTIKAKFGTLILDENLLFTHNAPITKPTTAPTISSASGNLKAGLYRVAYSYANERGQTLLSPYAEITLTANQKINVSAITPPSSSEVIWYVSPAENSRRLRYFLRNSGATFEINSLPLLSAALPSDFDRTGCEVMRVCASFTDRSELRSGLNHSNVLKATYKWILGNREKSINAVWLKFRDSTQDFRLVELRLRDDKHIAKTKKVSPLKIESTTIDNYNQAYRIASGLLAENRDADFFYEWTANRAAMFLEEGDVVCVTDAGSGVFNLPVRIESINYDDLDSGLIKVSFVARKYSTTLYDDSVAERQIPVISEN